MTSYRYSWPDSCLYDFVTPISILLSLENFRSTSPDGSWRSLYNLILQLHGNFQALEASEDLDGAEMLGLLDLGPLHRRSLATFWRNGLVLPLHHPGLDILSVT